MIKRTPHFTWSSPVEFFKNFKTNVFYFIKVKNVKTQ